MKNQVWILCVKAILLLSLSGQHAQAQAVAEALTPAPTMPNIVIPSMFTEFRQGLPANMKVINGSVIASQLVLALLEQDPLLLSEIAATGTMLVPLSPLFIGLMAGTTVPLSKGINSGLQKLGVGAGKAEFAGMGTATVATVLVLDVLLKVAFAEGKLTIEQWNEISVDGFGIAAGYTAGFLTQAGLEAVLIALGVSSPPGLLLTTIGGTVFCLTHAFYKKYRLPTVNYNARFQETQAKAAALDGKVSRGELNNPAYFAEWVREYATDFAHMRNALGSSLKDSQERYLKANIAYVKDAVVKTRVVQKYANTMWAPNDKKEWIDAELVQRMQKADSNHTYQQEKYYDGLKADSRFTDSYKNQLKDLLKLLKTFGGARTAAFHTRMSEVLARPNLLAQGSVLKSGFDLLLATASSEKEEASFQNAKHVQVIASYASLIATEMMWHHEKTYFKRVIETSFEIVKRKFLRS
jgi:hypothetical protein